MKTAISLPDPLFQAAEEAAAKLSISRSELYSTAIQEYLEKHVSFGVTEKLNEIYSQEASGVDEGLALMQVQSIAEEEW